jgi:hypothetical protein
VATEPKASNRWKLPIGWIIVALVIAGAWLIVYLQLCDCKRSVFIHKSVIFGVVYLTASFLGWLIYYAPKALVSHDKEGIAKRLSVDEHLKAINDRRTTLIQATLLLIGAYLTWSQLNTTRDGQVTERYINAVSYLGSKDRYVRVGAIHALGRIAKDSKADRERVTQVLIHTFEVIRLGRALPRSHIEALM